MQEQKATSISTETLPTKDFSFLRTYNLWSLLHLPFIPISIPISHMYNSKTKVTTVPWSVNGHCSILACIDFFGLLTMWPHIPYIKPFHWPPANFQPFPNCLLSQLAVDFRADRYAWGVFTANCMYCKSSYGCQTNSARVRLQPPWTMWSMLKKHPHFAYRHVFSAHH